MATFGILSHKSEINYTFSFFSFFFLLSFLLFLRLMVSGSAALPEPIMKTWQEITGWD